MWRDGCTDRGFDVVAVGHQIGRSAGDVFDGGRAGWNRYRAEVGGRAVKCEAVTCTPAIAAAG